MQNLPVYRIGEGHDTHRTIAGRPLMLGGVQVDSEFGLDGHSDADVLLHAIIDALLGASGSGDIGTWFPNSSDDWKDADSSVLLADVVQHLQKHQWELQNLDCTIHAEKPRLESWKPVIRQRLSELLHTDLDRVNVKAKSGEAVGPVGRCEAITASAVVLLSKKPKETTE